MKTVRWLSGILFWVVRVCAYLYGITVLYAAYNLIFEPATLVLEDNNRFIINYPFTGRAFLLGWLDMAFLCEMFLGIGLYAVFFYLLSNVFKIFRDKPLFTAKGISHLTRFYFANLTVPVAVAILLSFISSELSIMFMIVVLHAILGIFAYFMTAIFKQGYLLQKDQELYI
ncbi:DUF2975 domain-containing protein [Chitinophaga caeni]|uniref:DUF2975 domain-containing protein n=1 Tax=Chitinophaga caeni TaxID=2029983 RepID=A0A291QUW8_9BACT|nr:DUF2975 domain-containing protein [Chitinophaga caeni]ATL47736.1 DUF2975 domain-containing protein [Chitinophaga caeni]